jgi:hypothetical protein
MWCSGLHKGYSRKMLMKLFYNSQGEILVTVLQVTRRKKLLDTQKFVSMKYFDESNN